MTAPKMTPDELLASLGALPYGEGTGIEVATAEIGIAQAVQLCRIAEALEKITKEGIYTWPQDSQRSDTVESSSLRRR